MQDRSVDLITCRAKIVGTELIARLKNQSHCARPALSKFFIDVGRQARQKQLPYTNFALNKLQIKY